MKLNEVLRFSDFRWQDIPSSLVVFFIAMPLSLGIALASGATLASGLIAAIVGGIVVAFFRSAPLSISGPAAGLSAFCLYIIQSVGWSGMVWITILAGLLQVCFGLFKIGKWFELIPQAVIDGTLSAIGFIIVVSQIFVMMDHAIPGNPLVSLMAIPSYFISTIANPDSGHFLALMTTLICIGTIMVWGFAPGFLKKIPAALIAVAVGVLVSYGMPIKRVEFGEVGSIMSSQFSLLASMDFPAVGDLLYFGIALAIIASAESLITARAVATLVKRKRAQNVNISSNRELLAQGTGNFLSGLCGGLPISAVMVRSAANVEANGQSHWSSVLHAVLILGVVLMGAQMMEVLPLSVLSAILIMTGLKLLNFRGLLSLCVSSKKSAALWVLTMGSIFFTDLLKGLVVGITASILMAFIEKRQSKKDRDDHGRQKAA